VSAKHRRRGTAAPPPPAPRPRRSFQTLALGGALALAAMGSYWTSFGGVLVLDDVRAIARNQTIRSLSTALEPPGGSTVAGRPVANLSFALNYALAPEEARDAFVPPPGVAAGASAPISSNLWGYHALNLVIHLASGLLLFGIARRTIDAARRLRPTSLGTPGLPSSWLAWAIALLWLVHPLQTEAVTYLVQRVESLMGLWFLATLYCAIRASTSRRVLAWSAASVVACALGMATKEVMVAAPLIVVLWDWTFGARPVPKSRWRLWACLAATWVVLAVLVWQEHRAPSVDVGQGMVWRYLATQAGVIVHYLRLAVFPSPLVFFYTWPIAASLGAVWPQVALVAALAAATVAGVWRRHPAGFAGAWFLLILAPTSSLLPIVTEVAAEHRMYLPLAALVACAVLVANDLGRRVAGGPSSPTNGRSRLVTALAAVLLAATAAGLGAATFERNKDYWSDETLWRDTVDKQPDNPRARIAYGVLLLGERRLADAEAQLRAAVALAPADPVAHGRLGAALAAQGRSAEGVGELEQAVMLSGRRDPQLLMVLAAALADQRRFPEAAAAADAAMQLARGLGQRALADELARRVQAYAAMAAGR
jgi:tetratricopeptide (TPR) repeat protein